MSLHDRYGTELNPGDCFCYEHWAQSSKNFRRIASVNPLDGFYDLTEMPYGGENGATAEMIERMAKKLTCTSCPIVFECLAHGVIMDAY